MKRTRQSLLHGIDAQRYLRAAAVELDALGKHNARVVEVDRRRHTYASARRDIYYLERENDDGSWSAESVDDINGLGHLSVRRDLRDNLIPALNYQLVTFLTQSGAFNAWEPAQRFVLDECRLLCAGRIP